jgi:integrase
MSVYRPQYRDHKTGKLRESRVWWYSFTFAGRRIQASSKSTRKTIATEAEKNRRIELERAYAGMPSHKPERRIRTVRAAAQEYRKKYAPNHEKKSVSWVAERLAQVDRILGGLLLPDLTEDRIAEYMIRRREEGAGNRSVNMEIECLARTCGRPWRVLWPKLKRLKEPKDIGRALESVEERALLEHAAKNRSPFVLPFIRIALLTGMRLGEIRRLRWTQIDLGKRLLTVGKAKTDAGSGREIPMSADLFSTFAEHAAWLAKKIGPVQPGWCVFPFSSRVRPIDPTRPITTIESAWYSVRKDAGVTCRFHDLRHTAYTKMVEADVPDGIIMALMGHVSKEMAERYSHVRLKAKRKAVESLSLERPKALDSDALSKESTKVDESASIN